MYSSLTFRTLSKTLEYCHCPANSSSHENFLRGFVSLRNLACDSSFTLSFAQTFCRTLLAALVTYMHLPSQRSVMCSNALFAIQKLNITACNHLTRSTSNACKKRFMRHLAFGPISSTIVLPAVYQFAMSGPTLPSDKRIPSSANRLGQDRRFFALSCRHLSRHREPVESEDLTVMTMGAAAAAAAGFNADMADQTRFPCSRVPPTTMRSSQIGQKYKRDDCFHSC